MRIINLLTGIRNYLKAHKGTDNFELLALDVNGSTATIRAKHFGHSVFYETDIAENFQPARRFIIRPDNASHIASMTSSELSDTVRFLGEDIIPGEGLRFPEMPEQDNITVAGKNLSAWADILLSIREKTIASIADSVYFQTDGCLRSLYSDGALLVSSEVKFDTVPDICQGIFAMNVISLEILKPIAKAHGAYGIFFGKDSIYGHSRDGKSRFCYQITDAVYEDAKYRSVEKMLSFLNDDTARLKMPAEVERLHTLQTACDSMKSPKNTMLSRDNAVFLDLAGGNLTATNRSYDIGVAWAHSLQQENVTACYDPKKLRNALAYITSFLGMKNRLADLSLVNHPRQPEFHILRIVRNQDGITRKVCLAPTVPPYSR